MYRYFPCEVLHAKVEMLGISDLWKEQTFRYTLILNQVDVYSKKISTRNLPELATLFTKEILFGLK